MSSINLDQVGELLKCGIPIGTVFDMIIENPRKYTKEPLTSIILQDIDYYKSEIDRLRLKGGYSVHLLGTFILNKLFEFGIPEYFITDYIIYPLSYQFITHMPFIDNIQTTDQWPIIPYQSLSLIHI